MAMFPATPPALDITRPKLRHIAHWIRDELDPIIAREGPEHLRPDDVLILHDTFQALRTSTNITALDLRATGIHKAVMDVAGMATRWPGRLCDDCDKIISIWTSRFGRLEDLHPFLYGRGGRLEGIASVEDSTKQALVKRWQNTCPEKIATKKSHRHGNLGFRAGEWWINPLFACHAGIIDIDSVEGGICYDTHGAYAILLKDIGEIEAPAESNFKYRCGRNDKGRFRLTAATPKSRQPIRILRSHSINSIWGPKAGVRYEGLYNVVGWALHQVKTADISGTDHRAGDIVYDIHLVRHDPVAMEEVVKIPTTFQVDEYTEYKRLRKVYRELQRKGKDGKPEALPLQAKVIPPILPMAPIIPVAPPIPLPSNIPPAPLTPLARPPSKLSPKTSRVAILKRVITTSAEPLLPPSRSSSPRRMHEREEQLRVPASSMLDVPAQTNARGTSQYSGSESLVSNTLSHAVTMQSHRSIASSNRSHTSDIKKVAPWIDHELDLYTRPGSPLSVSEPDEIAMMPSNTMQSPRATPSEARRSPSLLQIKTIEDKKYKFKIPLGPTDQDAKSKESRKSVLGRGRYSKAKLFDGAEDGGNSGDDYFSYKRRASWDAPELTSPITEHRRASSSHETPLSPTSPNSPLLMGRRDAIFLPYGHISSSATPATGFHKPLALNDASAEASSKGVSSTSSMGSPPSSLPVSFQSFISRSKPMSALTTPVSSLHLSPKAAEVETEGTGLAADSLRRFIQEVGEVKVSFRNPFLNNQGSPVKRRKSGGGVAPDAIV